MSFESSNSASSGSHIISIAKQIDTFFDNPVWASSQNILFKKLRDEYVNNQELRNKNKGFESRQDREIIYNNMKTQLWYSSSTSKPIIDHLTADMIVDYYICDYNDFIINFFVQISFGNKFKLIASLYKNSFNNAIHAFIVVTDPSKQRYAYLMYFSKVGGLTEDSSLRLLQVPEFEKIYYCMDMTKDVLYQSELMSMLCEIVLYYDETQQLGNIPISNNNNMTINEIINKFNIELHKTLIRSQYKVDMSRLNKQMPMFRQQEQEQEQERFEQKKKKQVKKVRFS